MFAKVVFRATAGLYIPFLNYLAENDIVLADIVFTPLGFTAVCQRQDYFFIAGKSKRFQTNVRIVRKKGSWFLFNKYIKRKGLFSAALVFLVFSFLFSNIIWKININTTDYDLRNEMAGLLFRHGIYTGSLYNQEKLDIATNNIMQENNSLGYLTLNFYKGVLECNVYYRTDKEDYISNLGENNIFSQKSGVISTIRVYDGFSQVVAGQSVSKGDILVSNLYTDRHGNIYAGKTRAYIDAACEEKYSVFVPFNKSAEILTGKTAQVVSIYIFDKEFKINDTQINGGSIVREKLEYLSVMGFCMPLTVKTTTYYLTEKADIKKDVITAMSYGKMQLEHMIINDDKLKKEISREYLYNVSQDGITVSCQINGIYQIT